MKRFILFTLTLLPFFLFSQAQWQDNGVSVRHAENIRWLGDSCTLEDGSTVIVWKDSRDDSMQIYANRIDENGNLLWGDGINLSNNFYQMSDPIVTPASDGNLFAAWYYYSNNHQNYYMAVQKVSPDGVLLWSSTGLNWSIESSYTSLHLTPNDLGGVFLSWRTYEGIKAKLINSDGSTAPGWNDVGNTIVSSSPNYIIDYSPTFSDNCLILAYIISNNSFEDVFMQKVDMNGNTQWGVLGIQIETNSEDKSYLNILNSSDGFWISWRYYQYSRLKIYRFNNDGYCV